MRISTVLFIIICSIKLQAQELFVYTEPASNMPAKSVGLRLNNWFMNDANINRINYHFIPEIMWGTNKNIMLHVEGFFSNQNKNFNADGLGLYGKYRFFSKDEVYKHFRLAAFTRLSINNSAIHQEEIQINGYNTGYQFGLIGTQLLHKIALSSTISYEHALNNSNGHIFPKTMSNNAINYSLSIGKLMLPKEYTSYKQVNVNLMLEFLGQSLLDNSKMYVDIAPSIQFIFNSQTRVDVGYRKELYSNMLRTAPNGFLIRIEHLLFNVF